MNGYESLKSNMNFQNVYKNGRSYANKYLVMYVLENRTDNLRVGISVSKKVGNSIVRHRLTRLIRESVRLNSDKVLKGYDLVIIARVNLKDKKYAETVAKLFIIDFFSLDKPNVDYVISNPPFSIRDAILKRLYEWRIPFAMIFNANGLFDSRNRLTLAKRYGAETFFVYPRIKFIDGNGERNSPPFQSCYWCYNILPKGLMFEVIEENAEQMSLEDYIEG